MKNGGTRVELCMMNVTAEECSLSAEPHHMDGPENASEKEKTSQQWAEANYNTVNGQ